jgi:hypothetical protein
MNLCPCCDQVLLSQFRNHRLTLFCQSCWQETPIDQIAWRSNSPVQVKHTNLISLNQVRSRLLQDSLQDSIA